MSKQVRTLILAGVAVVALVALLLVLVFLLPGSGGEDASSTAVSDRTTRPGRTRATAFLMIGEIRIDDLFGESVLKTDSQENIFQ